MGLFKSHHEKHQDAPPDPPSYDQLEQSHGAQNDAPKYQSNYGPNEYPEEKKGGPPNNTANGPPTYMVPQDKPYMVAPQQINIAYETDGAATRPGYKEYSQRDQQRVAQGDVPKPREAFGRGGAPLAPSHQAGLSSSSAFPGGKGPTYYNSSNN